MTPSLPLLLVSVRSAEEAREALLGGADIIDVKEPDRGSLGAADERVLFEAAREVHMQRPLSAAMGELLAFEASHAAHVDYRWLKLGLSGCNAGTNWRELWARHEGLSSLQGKLVAAAYADHRAADCDRPMDLAEAIAPRDSIFLVDTFAKAGQSVFAFLSIRELKELRSFLHSLGSRFALAGSLQVRDAEAVAECGPDIVGIRGAACVAGRSSAVAAPLVEAFRQALKSSLNASRRPMQAMRRGN